MVYKYETEAFDEKLAAKAGTIEEVVLGQYPDWKGEKIHATHLFMPEEEQMKMRAYIQERFKISDRDMALIYLDIFPSAAEWHRRDCECPVLDNKDAGKLMYINTACPLHYKRWEPNRK